MPSREFILALGWKWSLIILLTAAAVSAVTPALALHLWRTRRRPRGATPR